MIDPIVEKSINVLLEKDIPITSQAIASEIGMSVSSVKHNLDYIKNVVNKSGAVLICSPGKGIWIEANEEQRARLKQIIFENRDKSYYFSFRKNYILNILFHNNSNYTISIFADDLCVGKNVIIKDLEDIERWLDNFNLKLIKTRNKGINVEGGEFDKRQAIILNNASRENEVTIKDDKPADIDYRISQKTYSYFTQIYPQYDIFELQEYLREVEMDLDLLFDDISFSQLMEYIAVSFERIKGNNFIREATILNRCRVTSKQFEVAKNLIRAVSRGDIDNIDTEANCLAAEFAIYSSYGSNENDSVIKDAYFNQVSRVFIDRINAIISNKKILINENLIEDIGSFLRKKKMQRSYQSIRSEIFKEDIKRDLPSLYGVILTNVGPLENKLKVQFSENDVAYLTMLLDNAIEDIKIDLNVLLYTSFDYNTGKYLEKKIKKQVDNIGKIKAIRYDDLKNVEISKYDLVITTAPCPIENAYKISRRVDTVDIVKITNLVNDFKKKQQELTSCDLKVFNSELILTKQSFRRKEDVLRMGYKLMKLKGYATDGFLEGVLHREEITTTVIGNQIAIPHVYKEGVIQSGVTIITLDHPIMWTESEKVDIIFLIGINFETHTEINNFFAHFYKLIDDNDRIEQIRKHDNPKSILSIVEGFDHRSHSI